MNTTSWRERALHQLDILTAEVRRLDAEGDPRVPDYRIRIAELRLDVEHVAARSGRC